MLLTLPRLLSSEVSFPRSLSPLLQYLEATESPSITAEIALLPLFSPDKAGGCVYSTSHPLYAMVQLLSLIHI